MAATIRTPKKVQAFLRKLSDTCRVDKACQAAKIGRTTAYEWREQSPEFAAAWDKAKRVGITALEDEAHRRAFEGVTKRVYHNGHIVDEMQEYSDVLAIFLLKAHDPEKYRERTSTQLTGPDDGPVQFTDTERAAKVAAILQAAKQRREAQRPQDEPTDGDADS